MFKTLVVVDDSHPEDSPIQLPGVITFEEYLRDYPKLNEPKTQVINLCDTARYLSKGYYCSLLAEARGHKVLPSVKTINALRVDGELEHLWPRSPKIPDLGSEKATHNIVIYLGKVADPQWQKLATHFFQRYPAPLLSLRVSTAGEGQIRVGLRRYSFSDLKTEEHPYLLHALESYTKSAGHKSGAHKRYRWDMAILVNPDEKVPPSNKGAISRFIKAAAKLSINAQPMPADELLNIDQYDALFLRETTAIDHHTYRLACKAEASGLVVLDDPDSILRCCNKVYLHDAFNYQKVPSLNTSVINSLSAESIDDIESQFDYPLVLKMPEGSFSKGVFKIDRREVLEERLEELFRDSALVLAQEYLYTEYDWRVGVLNGRALYASKYYMARNHWQIYNHDSKRGFSGGFETLPTFEAPKVVLDAALKAAKVVGQGLYGVDIKVLDGRAYVLEVNDNPSIDHKVEDAYLGDELYTQIMAEFLRRLELRGR